MCLILQIDVWSQALLLTREKKKKQSGNCQKNRWKKQKTRPINLFPYGYEYLKFSAAGKQINRTPRSEKRWGVRGTGNLRFPLDFTYHRCPNSSGLPMVADERIKRGFAPYSPQMRFSLLITQAM